MKDLTDTKVFFINLPSRADRRAKFERQEALSYMPPTTRVEGVQGSTLNVRKDKRIGLNTRVQVLTEYRRSHYEIHSPGAIGASLSHLKAWKAFLKSGAQFGLILEDDAELPVAFAQMVKDCAKDLPESWDIWILGWNHSPKDKTEKTGDVTPFREVLQFAGAHCYILKRAAAEALVKEALPVETHVEYFMNNTALIHGMRIVRHLDLCIKQMDRIKNKSDVRKVVGCPVCVVDDKGEAIRAREANSA
jgi:GR25 family glycosyltransferase involved in LPS biosynthesis